MNCEQLWLPAAAAAAFFLASGARLVLVRSAVLAKNSPVSFAFALGI